ncbi:hypothetical protein GDO81_029842 [Engystomops pustulosus]|uniref:Uncharacterized protein n=1 Tax=Engystomops pustulosus TaxID=76066 RepID=A0AAV6YLT6_ENGPU|nr:hypothetical protein GDO81_029842 [Engystomops pustulosus]
MNIYTLNALNPRSRDAKKKPNRIRGAPYGPDKVFKLFFFFFFNARIKGEVHCCHDPRSKLHGYRTPSDVHLCTPYSVMVHSQPLIELRSGPDH